MLEIDFEAIVSVYHGEVYRYLRGTARPSRADDPSRETFLRAYRIPASLNGHAPVRTEATR